MADVAHQFESRSRLKQAWGALRGREYATQSAVETPVSFPELVWAHHERQKEVYEGVRDGEWEQEYRRRQKSFRSEHGEVVDAYWCRFEASGVALTELALPRRLTNFYRRDSILRLHTATDWRTSNASAIASCLHRWETAGIKASEVLRDTSERIALHRIFAASSRVLGFVDRDHTDKAAPALNLGTMLAEQEAELTDVDNYYRRAGENTARIVYFRGMLWGTALLALIVGGAFLAAWGLGWLDPRDPDIYTLFVCIAMGAAGAILSVMTRMAKTDGFNVDFEVGRKSVRFLGGLRPWIGATFAFVIYLALKSSLIEILQGQTHGIYFFATVSFLAGFSERHAKVLLDSAIGGESTPSDATDGSKKQ